MKNEFVAIVLSFLASLCFLSTYFFKRDVFYLILGIVWLIIAIGNYTNYKKKRK